MQALFLLPSLIYAAVFAIQGNNPWMMVATFVSTLLALVVRWRINLRGVPNEQTSFRLEGDRVWLDDRRLSRSALFWTRAENKFVFEQVSALLAESSSVRGQYVGSHFELQSDSLDFVLGFNSQLVIRNLRRDGPHTILVGPTGAGKTVLLNQMLSTLIRFSRIELLLLDFKGGTGLARFKIHSSEFATDHDVDAASRLLEGALQELERRELSAAATPLLLVIDELAHLLAKLPRSIDALNAIAARGRAFGIYLLLTNQNLVGVPRSLMSNVRLRILVGDADPVDAAMLGQGVRQAERLQPVAGLAIASVVSHQSPLQQFYFALPSGAAEATDGSARGLKLEPRRLDRARRRRPGSTGFRRASSNREPARHRQHRPRASPGSQLLERKARLRW
jgi:S-DNA-T family DNA segregation ATPase FtsK/SpoIIIE